MAQDNYGRGSVVFAPCPFCKAEPSVREATEQERSFAVARRFRLSHKCDGVNCLLYGRSIQDLSYEWTRFLAMPIRQIK